MRKLSIILLLVAGTIWAQSDAGVDESLLGSINSVQDLDLRNASIQQAGADSFCVRSVGIGGTDYALTFTQDSSGTWTLTALSPESDTLLPARAVMDFASLTAVDGQTLQIDGVIVGGQVYSGTITVGENADLTLTGETAAGSLDAVQALALATLAVAESTAAFQEELEELTAERNSLVGEVAALEAAALAPPTTDTPVTDEQVVALLKERDLLAGDLVGVAMENNRLRDEKKTLAEQITELRTENQRLRAELAAMTSEVERLTELVEAYRSVQLPIMPPVTAVDGSTDDAAVAAPLWTMPGDYLRKEDLEAAAAAVTAELQFLEGRVAQLEEAALGLATLEEALRTGVGDGIPPAIFAPEQPGTLIATADTAVAVVPEGATDRAATTTPLASVDDAEVALATAEHAAELAAVTAELAALVRQNEELRREALELENTILQEILSNGLVALMSERLTDTVRSGFIGSEPDVGDWSITGSRAVQADSDAFFAKLAVPAVQSNEPVLYSFSVRSLDPDGWVGFGLHFFVSEVDRRRGYGMGKSLLVWLTRDPDVYKTQLTYLQLYRSDDDINMGRVLDSIIEEPISEFLDVEVLYEPDNQYLTVAIGGEDKIRYRTWFGIDAGVEVALRSLGAAEFTNFRIRTEPTESVSLPAFGLITW
ncbi:MAG: hypothetical protein KOO61_03760 [Spirochaetales bacterium]|nr:hypothetical protein [Spirochaetales bacterium]